LGLLKVGLGSHSQRGAIRVPRKARRWTMTKQALETMIELTDSELYDVGGGFNYAAVSATQLNLALTSVSGDFSYNSAYVSQSNSISISQS